MAVTPDATEYILSELTRRLNEVASRLEVGLTRMDGIYVRKDVNDAATIALRQEVELVRHDIVTAQSALTVANGALAQRLDAIEEGRQWLTRLCVGAIATGVLSAVVAVVMAAVLGGK